MPGGKLGLYIFCGLPFIISIIALLINGTEYLLIGLIAISTGPLLYLIVKPAYGGLYIIDPEKYPVNPKTRLAEGDILRISFYCIISGLFSVLGSFFLLWYEGGWGPEYYLEKYGKGLISNFDAMISVLRYGGAAAVIAGGVLIFLSRKLEKAKPDYVKFDFNS